MIKNEFTSPEFLASQGLSGTFPARFWDKVEITAGCWLWMAYTNPDGYGTIWRGIAPSYKIFAHVASYLLHYGAIPDGFRVCHSCDTPSCVRPDHLWLGTMFDNQQDMSKKGRSTFGERCAQHKLTQKQVAEIRQIYSHNLWTQQDLADTFGVSRSQIGRIINFDNWNHASMFGSVSE